MRNAHKLLWSLLMSTSLMVMVACNGMDEGEPALEIDSELMDIPTTLKSLENGDLDQGYPDARVRKPTYATFNAALGVSGLASVFARNELTVFAPTDAAFAALNLNPGNIRNQANLKEILLYHVVAGTVLASDLEEGFVPTLNGAAVEISLISGAMVNNANIILTDKRARNGVIHGIDAVLLPPTQNIVELASGIDDFSILVAAVVAAELVDDLANTNNLTVFAPTNAAFLSLLDELEVRSLQELIDKITIEGLRSVLRYHVLGERVFSTDLTDGNVTTLLGKTFEVDLSGPKLIDLNDRESNILKTDVQASNGVIHVIDHVILP